MATAELNEAVLTETEAERVTAWRREQLLQAGYDETTALYLAERVDVDLHVAEQLLRQGCTPNLAVQILS